MWIDSRYRYYYPCELDDLFFLNFFNFQNHTIRQHFVNERLRKERLLSGTDHESCFSRYRKDYIVSAGWETLNIKKEFWP